MYAAFRKRQGRLRLRKVGSRYGRHGPPSSPMRKFGVVSDPIYIYFPLGMSTPRDEMEDSIEQFLGGRGEVTGSGTGSSGSNLDVELVDVQFSDEVFEGLMELLRTLNVPARTRVVRPKTGVKRKID